MQSILTVFTFLSGFLFVFSTIIVLHELGHYWAGRLLGAKIDIFSLGFGPRLLGFRAKTGVDWRISAMPLGGYVKFEGDMDPASFSCAELVQMRNSKGAKFFAALSLWRRAVIVAAGPLMNFILSVFIFAFLAWSQGDYRSTNFIDSILPESPAEKAGLRAGDYIVSVNGEPLTFFSRFHQRVLKSVGETFTLGIERNNKNFTVKITPESVRKNNSFGGVEDIGQIGISVLYEKVELKSADALFSGFKKTWELIAMTGAYMKGMVTGRADVSQLGGPLRIATISGLTAVKTMKNAPDTQTFSERLQATGIRLLYLIGVLSVGLGFVNLLPIPALDGGHLFFYLLEALRGQPPGLRLKRWAYHFGFFVLLSVFFFSTWNDIRYLQMFHS